MPSRPRTSLQLRVLSYALALGCGVGLAHATRSRAPAPAQLMAARVTAPSAQLRGAETATVAAAPADGTGNADGVHDADSIEAHDTDRPAYADGLILEGGTPHRLILFTFDDGPDRRTTPLLLDRLDAVGVKAVFFLTASRIAGTTQAEREQAALAREIQARGHLIGSHTVDHLQLPLLDEAQLREQVIGAEEIFQRALGFRPTLFRPPGGAHSERTDTFLANRGYTSVLWNVGTGDFQVHSAQQVFDTFVKVLERRERENGERGGIVLMHDTYTWSVDAFQMIFAELWQRNCKLLATDEELYDVVPNLDFFYQPRGDAEAGAVAEPARLPPELLAERQARLRTEAAQRCNSTDGF